MADLALSFLIDRGNLGLQPLECNDHQLYRMSDTMFGGQVSWQRTQVGGPNTDGQTTTSRQLQMVSEPVNIDVFGRSVANGSLSAAALGANMKALEDAISQNYFTVTITIDGYAETYGCEASDYQRVYTGPRWTARFGQVQIQMLRTPKRVA